MKTCSKCKMLKPLEEFTTHAPRGIKKLYPSCKLCANEKCRLSRLKHINKRKQKDKEYAVANKVARSKNNKKYRELHRDKLSEYGKIYRQENKAILTEKARVKRLARRHSDMTYRMACLLRNRIRLAVKSTGIRKASKTADMLGCDFDFLKIYLEQTWYKNYPETPLDWSNAHIDHIIPLASATTEQDLFTLNHYTNLQLLSAQDNLSKGNKYAA